MLGIVAATFGLKNFLLPNKFLDGGATCISLLINEETKAPLSLLLLANIPFIIIAIWHIDKWFAIKTLMCIGALAACVAFVPMLVMATASQPVDLLLPVHTVASFKERRSPYNNYELLLTPNYPFPISEQQAKCNYKITASIKRSSV